MSDEYRALVEARVWPRSPSSKLPSLLDLGAHEIAKLPLLSGPYC